MAHQVRYDMHWGHTVAGKDGPVEVTRADYNKSFGADVPEPPEIPPCAFDVYQLWMRLGNRRQAGESTCPLLYRDIEAFVNLSGRSITPEELQMIEAMDNAFISQVGIERKAAMDRRQEHSKKPKK